MSSTADTEDVVEVSTDGVTVRKTFTADEFPVPAIRFEIESNRDDPVTFQLSENIPESFPMDKVGFHPDYHSDDWTAFQDNHVEFTAELEPDERLETVYGIQVDDESRAADFLAEPPVVDLSADADDASDADELDDEVIGNIVSDDRNQAVKDMISGESESVPGLDDEEDGGDSTADSSDEVSVDETADDSSGLDLDLSDVDADPADTDDTEAEAEDDAPDIDLGFEEETVPEPDDADESSSDDTDDTPSVELDLGTDSDESDAGDTDDDPADESGPEIELDLEDAAAAADEDEEPSEPDSAGAGESGESDAASDPSDADESADEPLESTAEAESDPTAVEDDAATEDEPAEAAPNAGSIASRLATEIRDGTVDDADLETIRDELDLEPSGPDTAKIEHLQSRVEEVAAYTDSLETFLEENGTGAQLIEDLTSDLEALEDDIAELDDRVEGTDSRVDDLTADVDAVEEDIESVEDDVESVEDELETVADDLEDVRSDVTDIQEWRDQLGSMFSE